MITNKYLTNLLKNAVKGKSEIVISIDGVDVLKEDISKEAKEELKDSVINSLMNVLELDVDDLE